jgi:hypothetical protein
MWLHNHRRSVNVNVYYIWLVITFYSLLLQILADNTIRDILHYRIKWVAIPHQGNTWEPKKHLIGDKAEALLNTYIANKEVNRAAAEKRKSDALAGRLVETGEPVPVPTTGNTTTFLQYSLLFSIGLFFSNNCLYHVPNKFGLLCNR